MLKDLHVHSTFSDGKNTPEENVLAAIEKGMDEIGFSDHSYTFFDESYCIKKRALNEYIAEITRLKSLYAEKIKILCGIEQDYYSEEPTDAYDYVIGSVHYVKCGSEYVPVDHNAATQKACIAKYFGGDADAYAEAYFAAVADVYNRTHCDIIGHFDLLSKFREKEPVFDENSPRYIAAWMKAADELLKSGKPFEINTGAIGRGYRTTPYPSEAQRKYISAHGGSFILSSDSHKSENLCFGFDGV